MDVRDGSKPRYPTIDYETRYWTDKLGVPVEHARSLVSGRRAQRSEQSVSSIELAVEHGSPEPALRMA